MGNIQWWEIHNTTTTQTIQHIKCIQNISIKIHQLADKHDHMKWCENDDGEKFEYLIIYDKMTMVDGLWIIQEMILYRLLLIQIFNNQTTYIKKTQH